MLKQRNYANATWDPTFEGSGSRCFAFFALRSSIESAKEVAELLDMEISLWPLPPDTYMVGFDYEVGQGPRPFHEMAAKLWELAMLGIEFHWTTDPVPEMPPGTLFSTTPTSHSRTSRTTWPYRDRFKPRQPSRRSCPDLCGTPGTGHDPRAAAAMAWLAKPTCCWSGHGSRFGSSTWS